MGQCAWRSTPNVVVEKPLAREADLNPGMTVTATGGTPPYTWTLGAGTALPAGLSLTSGNPSATISGTPTVTGTFRFTLDVKDSAGTPATTSASFLVTVTGSSTFTCPSPVNLTLCGTYGFGLRGFDSTGGTIAFGGALVADNAGHVVSGGEEANGAANGHITSTITGGSYVMDSSGDGRGVLTLIDASAAVATFRFALESAANAGPGPIEEFDSTGILAEGIMWGPEPTPMSQIPANTVLSLGLDGVNSADQRVGVLGHFEVGAAGCNGSSGSFSSQTGEPVVSNTAGTVNTSLTVTGSCTAANSSTGEGTAQITISGGTPFTSSTLHFAYLEIVGGGVVQGVIFLETDAIGTNQPILSGLGTPAATPGSITATTVASLCPCLLVTEATTTGTVTSGADVDAIVQVTSPATGSFSGVVDKNAGGTITTQGTWPYTSYTVDSNGVGTITGTGQKTIHFIIDNSGTFGILDESGQVQEGTMRQQNSVSIESPGSSYIVSRHLVSIGVTKNTVHVSGVIVPTGTTTTGTLPGTVDAISSAGSFPGATASGTYSSISSTTGRGTGTANLTNGGTVNVVIYAFRHRQFLVLDVQSTNPYVMDAHLQ
jgi:large repetitive protein